MKDEIREIAILNYLKVTADDAMGLEPGDRHMTQMVHDYIKHQAARIEKLEADVLHWKGMTKGRESEIDKRLARIAALEDKT